jgi:hypothetical protein
VIPFPPLRPSTSNKFYSFVACGLKKSTRNDFPPYSTPLLNHLISLDFSRSLRKVTQQEVTDPPMADVRSKCVPGQHITFPWSAQFGRKKEINSAGDSTDTKLLMIPKQSLFNEKHHFVASRKNYSEHKQAMKTAQAPHCRSEIFPAQLLPNNSSVACSQRPAISSVAVR